MRCANEPDSADPHQPLAAYSQASPAEPVAARLILRQRKIPADWREVQQFLGRLTTSLRRSCFSVCIVSDRIIRRYNGQFRGKNEATDVLSFPFGDLGGSKSQYLGDILISAETAQRNATQCGLRVEDEIKALILHGLLHLLGKDHERDRGQMARSERLWGARLGLPQTLLAPTGGARLGFPGRKHPIRKIAARSSRPGFGKR